jgi:putative ABC transport system ATP-binding protein
MRVTCGTVIPDPLAESGRTADGIWGGRFCLGAGESVLVTSPSGRGKTTLLHLLYGIRHDYRGEIYLDGADSRALDADAWLGLRRERLSLVFQDLRLFDALTAAENIEMVRSITGDITPGRVREMAAEMGIVGLLDTPCSILSTGQRQRVAVLRSLARPFTLLLLDEPFSHLDAGSALATAGVISRRRMENGAAVIVTGLDEDCPLPVGRTCVL